MEKRQRTKKKELDWQRARDDENEYGILCSVKALDRSEWRTMVSNLYAETIHRLIDRRFNCKV